MFKETNFENEDMRVKAPQVKGPVNLSSELGNLHSTLNNIEDILYEVQQILIGTAPMQDCSDGTPINGLVDASVILNEKANDLKRLSISIVEKLR